MRRPHRTPRVPVALGAIALLLTAWVAVGEPPAPSRTAGAAPALGLVRDLRPSVQPVRDAVVVPLVAAVRSVSPFGGLPSALAAIVALLALIGWGRIELGRPVSVVTPRHYAFAARRAPPAGSVV